MKWANCCGVRLKRFLLIDVAATVAIPLSEWADAHLALIAKLSGLSANVLPNGATLLGERAVLNNFRIPEGISAGGGCRFYDTRDGSIALNLSRPSDREILPALLGDAEINPENDTVIALRMKQFSAAEILDQGRSLGLAIAALHETPDSPACMVTAKGQMKAHTPKLPLVIDLSSLWAGPLAAHLLLHTGAQVVKVESINRPDSMRDGDPDLFALLNGGKANVALDLREPADRDALIALIHRADIVIEAARPRALLQLGIDADVLVRDVPGLVWATITGHGIYGEAANWIGFGDDTAVAGGLSAALHESTGTIGFVGDAIADPITGIYAAHKILEQRESGQGARMILSMSGIIAEAIADEQTRDAAAFAQSLLAWAAAKGHIFPRITRRNAGAVAPVGHDNAAWLGAQSC